MNYHEDQIKGTLKLFVEFTDGRSERYVFESIEAGHRQRKELERKAARHLPIYYTDQDGKIHR